MATVYAHKNDTVDVICWRAFGYTQQVVEQTLALNPGLAAIGITLPQGTAVQLPDAPRQPMQPEPVKLWN